MISAIKEWLLKRRLAAFLALQKPIDKIPKINKLHRIGLLHGPDANTNAVEDFVYQLRQTGRQVTRLVYTGTQPAPDGYHFSDADSNWYGWYDKGVIDHCRSHIYDCLICLSTQLHPAVEQVILTTQSHMTIATSAFHEIADLTVAIDTGNTSTVISSINDIVSQVSISY